MLRWVEGISFKRSGRGKNFAFSFRRVGLKNSVAFTKKIKSEKTENFFEISDEIAEEFYNKVFKISEDWESEYHIKDKKGDSWQLMIAYKDGKRRMWHGTGIFPENFDEFLGIIEDIITVK